MHLTATITYGKKVGFLQVHQTLATRDDAP